MEKGTTEELQPVLEKKIEFVETTHYPASFFIARSIPGKILESVILTLLYLLVGLAAFLLCFFLNPEPDEPRRFSKAEITLGSIAFILGSVESLRSVIRRQLNVQESLQLLQKETIGAASLSESDGDIQQDDIEKDPRAAIMYHYLRIAEHAKEFGLSFITAFGLALVTIGGLQMSPAFSEWFTSLGSEIDEDETNYAIIAFGLVVGLAALTGEKILLQLLRPRWFKELIRLLTGQDTKILFDEKRSYSCCR